MNNINSTGIDKDNLKVIQTRKEYLDTLLNQLGSDQVTYEKLVAEVAQELKNLYSLVDGLQSEITRLRVN
jgi:peptidoglycan hydrolase CwlO-like protein